MKIIRCHLILLVIMLVKVTCQEEQIYQLTPPATAGQLCISECGTCPVICPSPPSPGGGVIQPLAAPPPRLPPLLPPSPPLLPPSPPSPPETIQPLFPPPPLPPLLPLLPPPPAAVYHSPPQASHTRPPPPPLMPPSGGKPKGGGSGGSYQPSPQVPFPYVINPATPAAPTTPYPYYYFYESKGYSLSLHLPICSFFLIVLFSFQVGFIGLL